MVDFETINSKDIKFGNNNFIEVSKKKAVGEEGETIFFSLSRGFFTPENQKRYKRNFAIPSDGATLQSVIAALQEIGEGEEAPQNDDVPVESEEE